MLYAIDTEFIEDGRTIDLLSIGLVSMDGETLYLETSCVDRNRANPWVKQHVVPYLHPLHNPEEAAEDCPLALPDVIRDRIRCFVGSSPQFVGYYSAYDWVALCQLFGSMARLPTDWPMYCRDLRQSLDERGLQHITQPNDMPHHALSDAHWIMKTFLTLGSHDRR